MLPGSKSNENQENLTVKAMRSMLGDVQTIIKKKNQICLIPLVVSGNARPPFDMQSGKKKMLRRRRIIEDLSNK